MLAGDFVVQPDGTIAQLTETPEEGSYYTDDCKLWQPKVNEWCWFKTCNTGFELGQYVATLSNGNYRYRLNSTNSLFNCSYCEPLIGELPSHLRLS